MSILVENFHDIYAYLHVNLDSSEINLNLPVQNHNDFFYGFTIVQISLLKFFNNSISNNFFLIVFTNLELNYDFLTKNLMYLNINYLHYTFNDNPYSIQINLNDCWKIPPGPITKQLNNFYNEYFNQILNTNDNINDEHFTITFCKYVEYLKVLHNIKYENLSMDKKQLLSDLIFEHKDNMTDFAFVDIMEKIANL